MREVAVIRLLQGRLAWYPPGASDGPQWLDSEQARESLRNQLAQRSLQPVFAVPAAEVRLLSLQIAPEERRHLDKSLPFTLEEELAEDIGELHFAHCALGELDYAVAVCRQASMEAFTAKLAPYQGVNQWLPEPLLLPWQPGEWCVVLEDHNAIVRSGPCAGFGAEREMMPLLLQALEQAGPAPEKIVLYGQDQQADTQLLPADLRDRVQWRRGDLYAAMLIAELPEPTLNLRQGDWAVRLPLRRWWQDWRKVAVLFAVAVGVHMLSTYMEYRQLRAENLALRTAVQETYRKAMPRGAVVDAEKQLRRQLDTLSGSSGSSGFVSMMARVGNVVAEGKGSIVSINYNDKAQEMRLNLLAANYESVERIRAGFAANGLQATLENSSAQGDQVRARLRVGEGS
ncbi:type II secretion system protein GspL [Pseudohalioglobus sediminis]|uniref:Type II secretion system protein L n=1 Tax=Pseudohalioglobus sediminis TaxID=2606449 RepID=A0A5B0X524_9GAMM|nr:type II secretion system protein GspL [Pseudohalioglobus sediminis]KAA1194450.1 type II secretion system protein GspL [Pseudohalioglobus sediminis]